MYLSGALKQLNPLGSPDTYMHIIDTQMHISWWSGLQGPHSCPGAGQHAAPQNTLSPAMPALLHIMARQRLTCCRTTPRHVPTP